MHVGSSYMPGMCNSQRSGRRSRLMLRLHAGQCSVRDTRRERIGRQLRKGRKVDSAVYAPQTLLLCEQGPETVFGDQSSSFLPKRRGVTPLLLERCILLLGERGGCRKLFWYLSLSCL